MDNEKNNDLSVRERTKNFISELGVPATTFSKNVEISPSAYHQWMSGKIKLAKSTEKRISDYLIKYGF